MGIIINPSPADSCCMVCGKNVNELKPFGKAGDPLVGDFDGAKLVKTFRTHAFGGSISKELIEEYETILDEIGPNAENIIEVENKYGEEKVGYAINYDQFSNTISPSWECRDCIILE